MNDKTLYRAFGILTFVAALVTYLLTVQPSVPFWDCGEFSAAAVWQQVPHPPGAPLFLLIGKIFQTIVPFGDLGWRINLVSVFASSFTVLLLYVISVKVILNFREDPLDKLADQLAVYGSAFVGSLALIYSDTFWFNAVESEVYATSSLFVALVVYLLMKWNENYDRPGNEKYLLLIAYLIGLSTGVHLLSILTVFSIVYLVYFRKYEFTVKGFVITSVVSVVLFFLIYPGIVKWLPTLLDGALPFKNDCREYLVEGSSFVTVATILGIIALPILFWRGWKNHKEILKLATMSLMLMILGYSAYSHILIRSNANPPMNENEPKNFHRLLSYVNREQYGEAPNWPRRYQTDSYYTRFYTQKDADGNYVYGEWYPPQNVETKCKDPNKIYGVPKFVKVNFLGELKYLWKYQIYHMYIRYFLWNYMGRVSDIQGADAAFDGRKEAEIINYKMGYAPIYPIRFYALPLLFGLLGLFFHVWKDPKMAFVYIVMFLMMGVLAAIAQNQQKPQPRERDYFYAGSFFVWCMWIGFGVYFLIEWIAKKDLKTTLAASVVGVSLLLVPVNMAIGGWKMHDRSGNYIPFDYSYNILQSCDKDAIVFTNGDNDTFPLWYLQDVEGVRRDVRIVNLSLGNTLWYIYQLKHREPWGAKKIPLSFSDVSLLADEYSDEALSYDFGPAQSVSIPVPKDVMKKFTNDSALIAKGTMDFTFVGKPYQEREGKQWYLFRVQDKLILDILKQTKWRRPVYFSTTVGPDAFSGLEPFFRTEGMVMRICPVRQKSDNIDAVEPNLMAQSLLRVDNSNNFHTEPYREFKLRNLNNMSVFYDYVHRRLTSNYRSLYINFSAWTLQRQNDKQKAAAILDTMNKYISTKQFPMPYQMEYQVAQLYKAAGAKKQADKFREMAIRSCRELIQHPEYDYQTVSSEILGKGYGPYRIAAALYAEKNDYESAKEVVELLEGSIQSYLERLGTQNQSSDVYRSLLGNLYDAKTKKYEYDIDALESAGKHKEAQKKALQTIDDFRTSKDPYLKYFIRYIEDKYVELVKKDGLLTEPPENLKQRLELSLN